MADDDLLLTVDSDEEQIDRDPRDDIPSPDAPPEPKTPEELKAALKEAQEKAGRFAAERDIALEGLRRPAVPIETATPTAPPPRPDDAAARAQYDSFLENVGKKQLEGDFKGATQDIMQFVDHLVRERTSAASVPIAGAAARQAVRNFKSSMNDDDLYPVVRESFEPMLEKALPTISTLSPDQQDAAIEAIYKIAVGESAIKRARNGRREAPPPYSTGSPSSGARPASRQRQLNAIQSQYVRSAREAGIPEERIRVVLDEMESV